MGIETAILIGLSAVSAVGEIQNSKNQAKQIVAEGNIAAQNKAKETQLKAARIQNSFLSSGLTLDGTPNSVISGAYDTGIQDIEQIRSNYSSRAKNALSEGRTAALSSLAGGFAGASFGGSMGDLFTSGASYLPDSFAYGLNDMGFGSTAFDILEKSDARAGVTW